MSKTTLKSSFLSIAGSRGMSGKENERENERERERAQVSCAIYITELILPVMEKTFAN